MLYRLCTTESLSSTLEDGDFCACILDSLWSEVLDETLRLRLRDCHESRMVAESDASYLTGFESTFGYEESEDVAARNILFLTDIEIERGCR